MNPGAVPLPDRIVLMGVSGCGKTTIGRALSQRMGVAYVDGDDLHSPANIARMASGLPLRDEDRWPWLDRVARVLRLQAPVIVGCSALRRAYRDRLRQGAGGPVRFVHLSGPPLLIHSRMAGRQGHFMPPSLLDTQFAALEPLSAGEGGLTLDIRQPPEALVEAILRWRDRPD